MDILRVLPAGRHLLGDEVDSGAKSRKRLWHDAKMWSRIVRAVDLMLLMLSSMNEGNASSGGIIVGR